LIPPDQHSQLVVVTNNGVELSIELLVRTDPTFLVFRGRVCGQSDDGRMFFVPYSQITFYYLNRFVKEDEIRELISPVFAFEAGSSTSALANDSQIIQEPGQTSELTAAFLSSTATPTPTPAAPRSMSIPAPPASMIIPPPARPVPTPPPPLPVVDASNGKGSILEKLRAQRNSMKGPSR
jgi:hypothetical protein